VEKSQPVKKLIFSQNLKTKTKGREDTACSQQVNFYDQISYSSLQSPPTMKSVGPMVDMCPQRVFVESSSLLERLKQFYGNIGI